MSFSWKIKNGVGVVTCVACSAYAIHAPQFVSLWYVVQSGSCMRENSVVQNWDAENRHDLIATLNKCLAILEKPIKIPLNVACSDVLKGVLQRSFTQFSAKVKAQIHGRERTFRFQNVASPQLETLNSAIRRALYEIEFIEPLNVPKALRYIKSAREVTESAGSSFCFPERFFVFEKEVGYCGEVLIQHQSEVVFNIYAYQDKDGVGYKATDSVSASSTDPGLREVWVKLDKLNRFY